MTKYNVHYICGHDGVVELFGPESVRRGKLDWMASMSCPNCYKLGRQAEMARESTDAAKKNKEAGLPELEGTPRQVAWAEVIRADKLSSAYQLKEKAKSVIANNNGQDQVTIAKITLEVVGEWENQRSAGWWISHRMVSLENAIKTQYQKSIGGA